MNKLVPLALALIVSCIFSEEAAAIGVCKKSEIGSLRTNTNATACATDSGFVFANLDGAPSDEQLATMCETDTCRSIIATILAINPEDCTLPLNENLNLMSDLVDPVVNKCKSMGIDIVGSSKVGSDGDVNVGDDDSVASASDASAASASSAGGSSSAATTAPTPVSIAITFAVATMLAMTL
ncbi:hypothetical protein F442_12112 [Phytophthora nicotianae P10297]|uniref:Elicitin n=3 Tax=Phytophthora nicotianae TaxID=4792 RepID=W2PZ94_PHYN3|nr:hypothetical protein PPTG_13821 [Phytophthora nicotianae INRA-310]ETM42656.1 hypothetical protein L914_11754 [Phytophthora nicotianae]ETN05976.1 hypothetical protein PPTG_13821 [Phytophthora nicotianae INRA-310]ETP40611.1 hypothetical protein F442_12112 [Phytophthora nicotianae P10297]KUF93737.1 hypothetical protein AM588_10004191 [Phytophthora nicotianae]